MISVGDDVTERSTGANGVVKEIHRDTAYVNFGGSIDVPMSISRNQLFVRNKARATE